MRPRAGHSAQSRVNDVGLTSLAFSPDGKLLLAGREDNKAKLWDAATGRSLRVLQGHGLRPEGLDPSGGALEQGIGQGRNHIKDRVESVAFSPDSKQALTGGDDWTARLWDVATGREIRTFQGHIVKVTSVAFSPDGKQVLTGNGDRAARLWDVTVGKQLRAFRLRNAQLYETSRANFPVALSPDGKHVLMGSSDEMSRLWDVGSGKEIPALQGHIQGRENSVDITTIAYSPDGKHVVTGSADRIASLWNAATGKSIRVFQDRRLDEDEHCGGVATVAFSPDGKQVLTGMAYEKGLASLRLGTAARLWDVATGRRIRDFAGHIGGLQSVAFSPNGKQVLTGGDDKTARVWDLASGKEMITVRGHTAQVTSVAFSPDGKRVLTGSWDKTARLSDAATGREIRVFQGHTGGVTSVAYSPDGKRVLTGSWDGTARLWDAASGREVCSWISCRDDSWVAVTPENYYMASRRTLRGVAFRIGNRSFPFDQFDLKFNRPDKVIERIGLAPPDLVDAYRQAYQKRLKRMKFTEDMLSDEFHLPEVAPNPGLPLSTGEKALKLKVRASDSKYPLDRLNVDVNGVPIYGANGLDLRKLHSMNWEQEIEVELSSGRNRVDVSVLNEKGAESLKETYSIQCNAPARKPNLFVVVVGVSDYQDARFPLKFADKDARDVADLFQSKAGRFGEVKVLRILNRDATREKIRGAKDFLSSSQADDFVVVFLAGHGLLDSKREYYFGTVDIDFAHPAERGLPYESIDEMLDGIRSRKKLLLMDTCHAGEQDTDDVVADRVEKVLGDEVKERRFRELTRPGARVGLSNSFQLLQELFADLRRGTGTVVIASAGGSEYAVESAAWNNGVFTHALLRGLKGEADRDRDGRVLVSELREFVEQEVRKLTAGQQSPTARRENLVVDFTFD